MPTVNEGSNPGATIAFENLWDLLASQVCAHQVQSGDARRSPEWLQWMML